MRNVVIAAIALLLFGGIWTSQRSRVVEDRAANKVLILARADLQQRIDTSESETAQLLAEIRRGEQRTKEAAATLPDGDAHESSSRVIRSSPSASAIDLTNGQWSSEAPFVLVDKKYLRSLQFRVLTQDGLSAESVKLFGLSEEEKSGVERSYREMLANINALAAQSAIPTNPPPEFGRPAGEARSLYIPPLEGGEQLRKNFAERVELLLGKTRGALFVEKAGPSPGEVFDAVFQSGGTLTLVERDGRKTDLLVKSAGGNSFVPLNGLEEGRPFSNPRTLDYLKLFDRVAE